MLPLFPSCPPRLPHFPPFPPLPLPPPGSRFSFNLIYRDSPSSRTHIQGGCNEAVPPGASEDLFLASLLSHPYSSRSNGHRRPLKLSREVRTEQYLALERMLERFKGLSQGLIGLRSAAYLSSFTCKSSLFLPPLLLHTLQRSQTASNHLRGYQGGYHRGTGPLGPRGLCGDDHQHA